MLFNDEKLLRERTWQDINSYHEWTNTLHNDVNVNQNSSLNHRDHQKFLARCVAKTIAVTNRRRYGISISATTSR